MKRKALVFVLAALVCVAIAGGGRAVAGESGRGMLQRGVAAPEVVNVVNFTAEPLFVVGETRITGAGGLRLPSLSLGAKSRLVIGHELAVAVNDLIRADCKAGRLPKNFVLVDLYEKCPLAEEGVFFKDKLHPNWKGHMLMAEAFFDAIRSSPAMPRRI